MPSVWSHLKALIPPVSAPPPSDSPPPLSSDGPAPRLPGSRLLRALLQEWGVVAGTVGGALVLHHTGANPFGYPGGLGWRAWLGNALYLWSAPTPEGVNWQEARQVGFAYLLGLVGDGVGYVTAAQWMTCLSMLVVIFAAALLTRALSHGGWPALLAGLVAGYLPMVREGLGWINGYPLNAALGGLTLAAAAQTLRSRHWAWAGITGYVGAWACMADVRGYGPMAIAAGLVIFSLVGQMTLRRRAALVAAFCLAALPVYLKERRIEAMPGVESLSLTAQTDRTGDWGAGEYGAVCGPDAPHGLARVFSPCGQAHRSRAVLEMRKYGLPPSQLALGLLLLTLLPGRLGWRGSLGAFATLGGTAVTVFVGMAMVTYGDRYILMIATPSAALLPVAGARVGDTVGWAAGLLPPLRQRPWLRAGLGAAAGWAAIALIAQHAQQRWSAPQDELITIKRARDRQTDVRWEVASLIKERLQPGDHIHDCANADLLELLAPMPVPILRAAGSAAWCAPEMLVPEATGTTYLVAKRARALGDAKGWRLVAELHGHDPDGPPLLVYESRAGTPTPQAAP